MTEAVRRLAARLNLIPQNPGVYLMKDAAGSVLYVGKAVNLRSRLRSYFQPNPVGTAKLLAMLARIDDFETILCTSEQEALFLESSLIKRHRPPYNILLKDDRDYPYICVTMQESYPRVLKAYRVGPDKAAGARYFGPYLNGDVARALNALHAIFPMKTCRRVLPRDIGKERPCLRYYIGRCIGPCKGDVPAGDYRAVMQQICRFLEGRYEGIVDALRADMNSAAEDLQYERAGQVRDRIQALTRLMDRQTVVSEKGEDRDVIGLAANNSEICLQKLEIRGGRLVATAAFFWPETDLPREDLLRSFVLQHYPDAAWIPPEILLPGHSAEPEALAGFLRDLRGGRCVLRVPERGSGRDLLRLANENAAESLRRHTLLGGGGRQAVEQVLQDLARRLNLPSPPRRIEAIDISNTGADDRAASLVVFQDGRPFRRHYRHFRIEAEAGIDDYEAMRQTLRRRLAHLDDEQFGSRPDLVIADGGIGHVTALRQVLTETGMEDIALAGIVKDDRHRTRGLVLPDGTIEELRGEQSAPGKNQRQHPGPTDPDDSADLPDEPVAGLAEAHARQDQALADRALLRLLTAIQDEAHRFANRYRRKLSSRRHIRYSLEDIPGIGPARRRRLLQHFQTLKKISEASLPELTAVPGLGAAAAQAVYRHYHPEEET